MQQTEIKYTSSLYNKHNDGGEGGASYLCIGYKCHHSVVNSEAVMKRYMLDSKRCAYILLCSQ